MSRDEFSRIFKELCDAQAVVNTGMPQATESEVRAMKARVESLVRQVNQCPWHMNPRTGKVERR